MAELIDLTTIMPDTGKITAAGNSISNNLVYIYVFVIVAIIFWILFKLSSHRIQVEKFIRVKGGYVRRSGRYCEDFDKKTKVASLKPMFGKEKLPLYNSAYFQKVRGMPFIGIMRTISLVFTNKYSPIVCMPDGELKTVDSKRWWFDTQKNDFLKNKKKGDIAYFLGIYAPALIIVCTVVFFVVLIVLQINTTNNFAAELNSILQQLGGR